MSWVAVGVAAVGAVSSMQQAKAKKKAQEEQNQVAAAQTMYSPWTGVSGQADTSPQQSQFGSALSGGLQGYMTGSMMKNANAKSAAETNALNAEAAKADVAGATDVMGGNANAGYAGSYGMDPNDPKKKNLLVPGGGSGGYGGYGSLA